jgi:uncharacterized protein YndB with AHSA1/START domain
LIHIDESVDVSVMWRIEVPRARVWQCLTDADLLSQWLGELVSGAVRAGSDFEVDHGDGYCCRSTVVACAEPSRLDFTWDVLAATRHHGAAQHALKGASTRAVPMNVG